MAKQKFVVRGGFHYESVQDYKGNYKDTDARLQKFSTGDVIESDTDLCARFPNKFDRVVAGAAPVTVTVARRDAVSQLIAAGTWTSDDRTFLETLTDDGFDRVRANSEAKVKIEPTKVQSQLGEDVTSNFQRAYDEQFLVFRNAAGKHQITKREAPTKPINKIALDQDSVEPFIDKFLKDK